MTNRSDLASIDPELLAEGLAIVGMAARFPGASNVAEYWDNLRNGVESLERISEEKLIEAGVPPEVLKDPSYVPVSGSLPDVEMFDAGYFGFSPKDAAITDPQHRHFLECAVEAFEDAGHSTRRFHGEIGVFAGCGMNSYFIHNLLTNPEMMRTVGSFLLRHTGNDRDFLPTTVSYKLDLRGPSMAIQTACSTSLVAIHAACQSLLAGECDMALAGGSTILVPNGQGYYYRDNEPVSPDGHCRAFDAEAAGTVLSSGTGVIVLRRLEDSIADGDSIHAVIRGSAVNNDGAGKIGYLAPSVEGHASAVAEALSVANISAESVSYIEAHGTGTPVGDPIEIAALTQAFRASTNKTQYCRIGSVKTNIGHLDTAAGVASLIKVVKSLEEKELAPTLNFTKPNPEIDFESTPFVVNAERREWTTGGEPRRAGVSSLGIGGTNAHVILEETPVLPKSSPSQRTRQILTLSAKTRKALANVRNNLASWLRENPASDLADLAFTLQEGRDYWEHRLTCSAESVADAAEILEDDQSSRVFSTKAEREVGSVAFMFSGAGGQYPNMCRGLYEEEAVFRSTMDECLATVSNLIDFDLKGLLFPPKGAEEQADRDLQRPSRLCPAVVVVEWSLVKLWKSWGVEPSSVIGHSLGEYVAACVAGVLSLQDMLRVVVLRGNLIEELQGGAMISLPLSELEALEIIGEDVDLAAVNSPGLCVASGTQDAIAALSSRLQERDIEARIIPVNAAGHSRHLDPILAPFREGLKDIKFSPPEIPYISNVTGTWADPNDVIVPEYWVRHLRQTVRFSQGMQTLIEGEHCALVEVGPGQSLCAFARQQPDKPKGVFPSVRKESDSVSDQEHALGALGRLWSFGCDVQWNKLRGAEERRSRLRLPTYPFEHSPYWVEPGQIAANSEVTAAKYLSKLESIEEWLRVPTWRPAQQPSQPLDATDGSWLVFLDESGVGRGLVERLRNAGQQVVTVQLADTFFRLGDTEFALAPERGVDGYEELVSALREAELVPKKIIHLWGVTADKSYRPGSSFLDRSQECGFFSLMFLMQALGESAESIENITVVTNGLFAVCEEKVLYPEKATVLGPVRVIPREFPTSCRCVDVSFEVSKPAGIRAWVGLESASVSEDQIRDVTDSLYAEVTNGSRSVMVALRAGERFEEVLADSVPKQPQRKGVGFRPGGVYLISGGLGGLGLALSERIGLEHQAKLVLLNRSQFLPEDEWDSWIENHPEQDKTTAAINVIRSIREAGGDVTLASCDITDLDAVRQTVSAAERRFGPLNGVLHAAASVSDGLIQTKTKEDAEVTFSAKLHGTRALDQALSDRSLDFFVLFSSTSAVVGLPGQIDYAAANAYLNAFAEHRSRADRPVLALDWGIWNDVGGAKLLANQIRHLPVEPSQRRSTHHPLLGDCIKAGETEWEWRADWSVADLWVLNEHRTGDGTPLLPGTAYLEIGEAAFRDATGQTSCQIEDISFLRPFVLSDDQGAAVRVRLERIGRDYNLSIYDDHTDAEYASMGIRPLKSAPQKIDVQTILKRHEGDRVVAKEGETLKSSQEAQLKFGPRWSVIREIGLSENQGYARLGIPDQHHADTQEYNLHPGLMDIATSFGIPLIRGWTEGDSTYVPLAYETVEISAPLEPEVFAYVTSHPENDFARDTATFDISLARASGEVLVNVRGYQMRKLSNNTEFVSGSALRGVIKREPTEIETVFLEAFDNGIRLEEGMRVLSNAVEAGREGALIACPINIEDWEKRISLACEATKPSSGITFERPDLETDFEPARNSLDSELIRIWQEYLGVGEVGIFDDFFELGGHSLIAVRMFARIKTQWGVDWPISVLFDAPNVAGLSDALASEVGIEEGAEESATAQGQGARDSYRYLVSMNRPSGKVSRPPLFIVAGMFGNVLNLRHLATHLGADQPVYALQAKGLYGEDEPHQSFEEAASAYIEEMRDVQPTGPYLLGGFSGGGVTAFEIAHQLLAAGEEVGAVVMLDAIPPHPAWPEPNLIERLQIKGQRIARNPIGRLKTRIKWEMERRGYGVVEVGEETPAEFRSGQIEQAFRTSLARYEMKELPLRVSLFRPELDRTFMLVTGRVANTDGQLMESENWWSPWVDSIDVTVVSGNHDSMVLEPNVKKLAVHVRTTLDDAIESRQCMGARSGKGEANGMAKREQGVPYAS